MKTYFPRHEDVPSQPRCNFSRIGISLVVALGLMALPLALDIYPGLNSGSLAIAKGGPGWAPVDGGPGGNNGGGKGGGKPAKGDLYGDMVYLLRDMQGVPILYVSEGNEAEEIAPFSCLQPLAIGRYGPGIDDVWTEADGIALPLVGYPAVPDPELSAEMSYFCNEAEPAFPQLRLMLRTRDRDHDGSCELSIDNRLAAVTDDSDDTDEPEFCDVIPTCANNLTEVEMGRLSILRSPEKVLDRQRDEAIRTINRYPDLVSIDHGGRLVVNDTTFDSPLINLALMREFLNEGALLDDGVPVWEPPENFDATWYTPLMAAAFGLAAGDDKLGAGIDPEVVVRAYLTLGVPDITAYMEKIDTSAIDDPSGLLRQYVDFDDFNYDRAQAFPGSVCWDELNATGTAYVRDQATIMDHLFFGNNYIGSGLEAFARAAEDARNVLVFVHDNNVVDVNRVFDDAPINCPDL